jgi:hypothetical protein
MYIIVTHKQWRREYEVMHTVLHGHVVYLFVLLVWEPFIEANPPESVIACYLAPSGERKKSLPIGSGMTQRFFALPL